MATILTKKSDTASAVPLAADLTNAAGGAELAVNATDKRLFSKTSGGTVVELGINPSSLTMPNGTANGVAYLNGSKVVTSGSALTFSGQQFAISSLGDQIKISNSVGNQLLTLSSNSAGSVFTSHDGTNFVPILWQSNTAELMRLTSTGLGIGTSTITGGYRVQINGNLLLSSTSPLVVGNSTLTLLGDNTSATGLLLNTAGNLGLGVTPSAWGSTRALQVNRVAVASVGGTGKFATNWYNDGTDRYLTTDFASLYQQNDGQHRFYTAPSGTAGNAITFTQAMTLDASGQLAVGITSPLSRLHVGGADTVIRLSDTNGGTCFWGDDATGVYWRSFTADTFRWVRANGNETARMDSSGNLLVGTTNADPVSNNVAGISFEGSVGSGKFSRSNNAALDVNRKTNDGELVRFYQDGTQEGNISVSGTTVSYNGGHLSRYAQTIAAKDDTLVKGTVLSNLDEMSVYIKDGQPVANEQLNKVKVSDTEGDANVAGVFVNWSHDSDHNVDEINMAMTGDMIIRIAQGVTVVRGDLLMSAGNGTAKPQGDDIVRSKTIAKVTSTHVTCTYADGSYCVPCVLMAC